MLVNLGLFAGLRITSVIVFFLLGIGASASSEKYTNYILIPALIIQLFKICFFYNKGKIVKNRLELMLILLTTFILYILGFYNLITF